MNCTTVRQHLLASERPDRPVPVLAAHLAGCPVCRSWHRRLVRLEQDIPHLPVPPSSPPAALLERVLHGPPPGQLIAPTYTLRANPDAVREGGRQKLALAFAMAASLVVFALGWWAWPRQEAVQPISPRLVRYLQDRNIYQEKARTPQERVVRLADLADKYMKEASGNKTRPEQLADLAFCFEQLGRNLLEYAEEVPDTDRAVLLRVSARLSQLESTATQLAVEWETGHRASARSLRQIAAVARDVDLKLMKLARRA
jgi:hypothetical protein